MLTLELLVHGWDFAVALGGSLDVTDVHADYVLSQTLTAESRLTAGFDDPVSVPDDAAVLDRLIAFTGRRP